MVRVDRSSAGVAGRRSVGPVGRGAGFCAVDVGLRWVIYRLKYFVTRQFVHIINLGYGEKGVVHVCNN